MSLEGFFTHSYRVITIKTGKWRENTYLVYRKAEPWLFIVDPGDDEKGVLEAIERGGYPPRFVLLTHAHYDHVASLRAVCDTYEIPFYLQPDDRRLLRQASMYRVSFGSGAIREPGTPEPLEGLGDNWTKLGFAPDIHALRVPGHTPGGVCYRLEGVAFSGDTLLNEKVGRTDLPGSDKARLSSSVENMLDLLDPDTMLLPGHGEPWTARAARVWWEKTSQDAPEYRA